LRKFKTSKNLSYDGHIDYKKKTEAGHLDLIDQDVVDDLDEEEWR
jgi:hypothetical protein